MRKYPVAAAFLLCLAASAIAAGKPTRFWNLTSATVTELRLAPAGGQDFGENLCLNDKDKSVDHDERLAIPDAASGVYDVKIGFADGRVCRATHVAIEAGGVFSIEDKDLSGCAK